MVSGSEMKALKTVEKENGQTTTRLVSRKLGIDPSYAAVLCTNLTKGQYLDRQNRGRFKITRKGRKALGWSQEDTPKRFEKPLPTHSIQKEEFHWRSVRTAGSSHTHVANGFSGLGRDDTGWCTMNYGSSNGWGSHNAQNQLTVLNKKTHACPFCKGTGKKNKVTCPVCRGKGTVTVIPPVVSCGYCRGKGVEKRTGRICSVCRGKGLVSIRPPVGVCAASVGGYGNRVRNRPELPQMRR